MSQDKGIEFVWDDGNVRHLTRHRVACAEVEELLDNDPVVVNYENIDGEDRWRAIGLTKSGRFLEVVFTVRGGKIRAISGWSADKKTIDLYLSEKRGVQHDP